MNYPKVFLLILFSFLVGLTAVLRPVFASAKKNIVIEKQAGPSSCPDDDCPTGEESTECEEDSEWGDEFESLPYPLLKVRLFSKIFINFSYLMLNPEHFASICIPPPERR